MLLRSLLMLAASMARVVQEGASKVGAADGLVPQLLNPLRAPQVLPQHPARAPPARAAAEEKSTGIYLAKGSQFPASKTPVRDHMTPLEELMSLTSAQTVKEAAILMNEWGFTGAPVVDDGSLVGIVSRKDLMRRISEQSAEDGDPASKLAEIEQQPVREIMSATPVTISPEATLLEASQAMSKQGFNRLMVSEPGGKLLGIITSADVIRAALCDEYSEIDYDAESRDPDGESRDPGAN